MLVSVLLMATIFGTIVNAFSLFALPVSKEIPTISIAMFTIAHSFITLAAIPLSPLVGNLLKKWDARVVIVAGIVLAAAANIGLSFTHDVAWLYAMAVIQGAAVTCPHHHNLVEPGRDAPSDERRWHLRMADDEVPEVVPPAHVDRARVPLRHQRFRLPPAG